MRVETEDLDAFQQELLEKHYRYARPGIPDIPWGSRHMSINAPSQRSQIQHVRKFTDAWIQHRI